MTHDGDYCLNFSCRIPVLILLFSSRFGCPTESWRSIWMDGTSPAKSPHVKRALTGPSCYHSRAGHNSVFPFLHLGQSLGTSLMCWFQPDKRLWAIPKQVSSSHQSSTTSPRVVDTGYSSRFLSPPIWNWENGLNKLLRWCSGDTVL